VGSIPELTKEAAEADNVAEVDRTVYSGQTVGPEKRKSYDKKRKRSIPDRDVVAGTVVTPTLENDDDDVSYLPADYAIVYPADYAIANRPSTAETEITSATSDDSSIQQQELSEQQEEDEDRSRNQTQAQPTQPENAVESKASALSLRKKLSRRKSRHSVKRELPIITIQEEKSGDFSTEMYEGNEDDDDDEDAKSLEMEEDHSLDKMLLVKDVEVVQNSSETFYVQNSTETLEDNYIEDPPSPSDCSQFSSNTNKSIGMQGEENQPWWRKQQLRSKRCIFIGVVILIILLIVIPVTVVSSSSGSDTNGGNPNPPIQQPSTTPVTPMPSKAPSMVPTLSPSIVPTMPITNVIIAISLTFEPIAIGWNIIHNTNVQNTTIDQVAPGKYTTPFVTEYETVQGLFVGDNYTLDLLCDSDEPQYGRVILYLGDEARTDRILNYYTYTNESFAIREIPFWASEQGLVDDPTRERKNKRNALY